MTRREAASRAAASTSTPGETITVQPVKTFPVIRDLVTDVSGNYAQNKRIRPFKPKPPGPDGKMRMYQEDVDRVRVHRTRRFCYPRAANAPRYEHRQRIHRPPDRLP